MTSYDNVPVSVAQAAYDTGYAQALRDAAAAIRVAGPATLRILPASHTGEVVLVDLAEAYAAMVEGLGG